MSSKHLFSIDGTLSFSLVLLLYLFGLFQLDDFYASLRIGLLNGVMR